MKKNIKHLAVLFISILLFNCGEDDSIDRNSDPTTGWIEFNQAASTTGQTVSNASIPLSVRVPIYKEGLTISYRLEAVEGDYTQYVTNSSTGSVYADPSDYSRNINIDLELQNMEEDRFSETKFDIILTSVDGNATIGIEEGSITTHRVTIPTYTAPVVPNDMFVGEYTIQDVVGTVGPNNGTENFESGTVTLSIDPLNQDRRLFSVGALPAFSDTIHDVTILFALNANDEVEVGLASDVDTGLACSAVGSILYTQASEALITVWDGSTDDSIIITYTEDPLGSCGGPFDSSFMLTKN